MHATSLLPIIRLRIYGAQYPEFYRRVVFLFNWSPDVNMWDIVFGSVSPYVCSLVCHFFSFLVPQDTQETFSKFDSMIFLTSSTLYFFHFFSFNFPILVSGILVLFLLRQSVCLLVCHTLILTRDAQETSSKFDLVFLLTNSTLSFFPLIFIYFYFFFFDFLLHLIFVFGGEGDGGGLTY